MLYYLFKEHNITPMEYYKMPIGEQEIIQAFFLEDMKRRERR